MFRDALALKYTQLTQQDELVDELTIAIEKDARQHREIRRLQSIPGFGPIVASTFLVLWVMAMLLGMAGMFLPHWGWFPGNTAVVIKISCWVSVNEGTNIYAVCWCMAQGLLFSMRIKKTMQ